VIRSFVRDVAASAPRPRVFRRCSLIAVVVGTLLTLINQFDVVATGHADLADIAKIVANYLIPFVVSNLGAATAADARGNA